MKTLVSLVLVLGLLCGLVACGDNQTASSQQTYDSSNQQSSHTHSYSQATCTTPSECECGSVSGTALGHSYSGKTCARCGASNPYYQSSQPQHTHYYYSSVTREATCGKEGVRTYTCSCGNSYTEAISKKSYHNWSYATCSSPDKCKDCGTTKGSKKEHDYSRYNDYKCSMCGKVDPTVQNALAQCSLQLPTLPKSISYRVGSTIRSKVDVTNITYKFEYDDDGMVTLTAKFSGTKTYDSRGSGQSDACRIGWKLYDPNGNVFRTGTFSSPSVAVGESFANQEEDLIYNFEANSPGKYRLEILDVN